jgi:hypothetical protein
MKQEAQPVSKVFEERNRAFRVLYDTMIELETCKNVPLYSILARNLRKMCEAELVAIGRIKDRSPILSLEAVV